MSKETSDFSEKSKLIDLAQKYTDDEEKARQMVSGQYNDVKVIKGKFSIDRKQTYGVFLIIINIPLNYIMNIEILLVPDDNIFSKANIFGNWKTFNIDYNNFVRSYQNEIQDSYEFSKHISKAIFGYDLIPDIENENLGEVTGTLTEIISKFYNDNNIKCQIEIEKSNSLSIELEGIKIEKPGDNKSKEEIHNLEDDAETDYDQRISDIESQAEYMFSARIIISPIKGKYINEIQIGEKIKIIPTVKNELTLKLARTFNKLTKENEFLPITVRIREKIPLQKSGYLLYGLAANNILVKIVEEENVKIETGSDQSKEKIDKGTINLIVITALLIGLIIITSLIIIVLL